MAKKSKKKKKQQKRRHFVDQQNHSRSNITVPELKNDDSIAKNTTTIDQPQSKDQIEKPSKKEATTDPHLAEQVSYMKRDAVHTVAVGGGIVVVLIVLWILFEHTGLGAHVYNLVKF